MGILNFGSLNLDYVYSVSHIVLPGETISSSGLEVFCGGKGLNQSIALARAGAKPCHAGLIGADGEILRKLCEDNGVDTAFIRTVGERSGNAIIQVGADGQNGIVLFGGANQKNDRDYVDEVLSHFDASDWLLLQNEVNELSYMITRGSEKGLKIALNPSPCDNVAESCDLGKVDLFFLNEVEGRQLTGQTEPEAILSGMRQSFPTAEIVLTLGADGAYYSGGGILLRHGAYGVTAVDTTAAGDTFTGYFLAEITGGSSPEAALRIASAASALAVSRKGACSSIPFRDEVLAANLKLRS